MADYAIGPPGYGQGLRDALNAAYPMTGLGEYGAMFPPNTGVPGPGSGPVPIPQPRPPTMAPPAPPQIGGQVQPQGAGVNPPSGPLPGGPVSLPLGPGRLMPQMGVSGSSLTRPPLDYSMLLRYAQGF